MSSDDDGDGDVDNSDEADFSVLDNEQRSTEFEDDPDQDFTFSYGQLPKPAKPRNFVFGTDEAVTACKQLIKDRKEWSAACKGHRETPFASKLFCPALCCHGAPVPSSEAAFLGSHANTPRPQVHVEKSL